MAQLILTRFITVVSLIIFSPYERANLPQNLWNRRLNAADCWRVFPPVDGHVEQWSFLSDPIFSLYVGYTSLLHPWSLPSWASCGEAGAEPAGPPFGEEDQHLRRSPFISTRQRRRIPFPSALPIAYHCLALSHPCTNETTTCFRRRPAAHERHSETRAKSAACCFVFS